MKAAQSRMEIAANTKGWFADAPVAMVVAGTRNQPLIDINNAALRIIAVDRATGERLALADLFDVPDLERIETARLQLSQDSITLSGCTLQCCGKSHPVDLTIQSQSGDTTVIAFHSAIARLELEQQLRQAAKMESVGMLAGGVAHDFNNLLTIISGYSQMLQASPSMTTERDKTAIEQVLKASERAAELTSQLLTFSRRRTLQPGVLEPAKLIDQTTLMLRRLIGEHIELRIQQAHGAGRIRADLFQIQQVVINLVINSRDAMPGGGILTIETKDVELDSTAARRLGAHPGPHVMIAVSDTGFGMDEVTRKRVFEPFFTTKGLGKGTGLGLSTVSGIVRQYGGVIDLYSEPGHGTTFKVFFPRVDAMPTEEAKQVQDSSHGSETVLFAEDEEGVRKMVTASLERRGYNVLIASSGIEALEKARSYPGRIDLLLTDLVMPHMNGRELAAILSAERPGTPVLFISGYAGETVASLSDDDTAARFLQKPFAPAELTSKIRELLDKRGEHNTASR